MYTIEETTQHIENLDNWGYMVDIWEVEDRTAIVWSEEVENKAGL
jgi:hypothetical protein